MKGEGDRDIKTKGRWQAERQTCNRIYHEPDGSATFGSPSTQLGGFPYFPYYHPLPAQCILIALPYSTAFPLG